MGAAKSTTSRQVQPSLPFQSRYHRLSPSSDSLVQPLRGKENQFLEQDLVSAIEASQEDLSRLEAAKLQSSQSHIKRGASKPPAQPKTGVLPATRQGSVDTAVVEKQVYELRLKIAKLESGSSKEDLLKKQGEDYEELKQKNAALEDKLMEMASTIAEMKCSLSNSLMQKPASTDTVTEIGEDDQITSLMNDVAACLLILVFLISILVGLHL